MNSGTPNKSRIGELRPSQLLYTFGVGAIVELPSLSVMVMGLDDWSVEQDAREVSEPRLLRVVQAELGDQVQRLLSPPVTPESTGYQSSPFDDTANVGVPVAPFPRWQVCPKCRLLAPISSELFQLKLDPYRRDRCRYVHQNCRAPVKPPAVVPARFLVACERGHLDDFPWVEFVHAGKTECRAQLKLYELGASGEVADIQVECETCGKKRRMSDAFHEEGKRALRACPGRWPHLRRYDEEPCKGTQRPILLGASNSWFPVTISVLSIPSSVDKLGQWIESNWADLSECESVREVKLVRKHLRGVPEYTDEQIWAALDEKKIKTGEERKSEDIKEAEWWVFSNVDPKLNGRDFKLREVEPPQGYEDQIDKVVLVERLREVCALTGFTRVEAPWEYLDVGDLPEDLRAPLCRAQPKWVPTSEVRGEGIFLRLSEPAIQAWMARAADLDSEFLAAHRKWRQNRGLGQDVAYPGVRYVLLHSLAHCLIRQISMECGYSTASIRERIYSKAPSEVQAPMAGILLYTAAPDSEGTLGGLVSLGEPKVLGRHLDQALEAMKLCASDPLCAEHRPGRDALTLHGAACHACLFLPETSCERGNKYLDRSVLVSTVQSAQTAFFADPEDAMVGEDRDSKFSKPRSHPEAPTKGAGRKKR